MAQSYRQQPGKRAALKAATSKTAEWPIGRATVVIVVVLWLIIGGCVVAGWISPDASVFAAAGVFTLAIAVVLVIDAAIDWSDPDEHGSLPERFQAERIWRWLSLERVPAPVRVLTIPACFVIGAVFGHYRWH